MTHKIKNLNKKLYNIEQWGEGYFDINNEGKLIVKPRRDDKHTSIELATLPESLHNFGLNLPILVRFTDILRDRVDTLYHAFNAAITENQYKNSYIPVYPIKVNQQHCVISAILNQSYPVGLESGSKAELIAILGLLKKGGIIVCNGYKDRQYIRLALIGKILGYQVYIVLERFSELEKIIEESKKLNVHPTLGFRIRLYSISSGNWQNTGGEKSKFGLSACQMLESIEKLRDADMLSCVQLIHAHIGSQVPNIQDIQRGIEEFARYYAELIHLGVPISHVDVGGGLGVDYEGTQSRNFCSMNYNVDVYAHHIVKNFLKICQEQRLPHPVIMTESGRATTAHHAVLITDVIDVERINKNKAIEIKNNDPEIVRDLWQTLQNISAESAAQAYYESIHKFEKAQSLYIFGVLDLKERAKAERIYFAICQKIQTFLAKTHTHNDILKALNDKLADKYFCNFSLFQSIPDSWGIDQIFPILPLQRLHEKTTHQCVVVDLTCDSDGRINYYVNAGDIKTTLPLHDLKPHEPYLLGIFLIGAYQEILGDIHNLFGDTDSVNVELTDNGYQLTEPRRGDSTADLLKYVHFNPEDLQAIFKGKVALTNLSKKQQMRLLKELTADLFDTTYLR